MAIPAIASGLTAAYQALPAEKKKAFMDWMKRSTQGAVATVEAVKNYAGKSESTAAMVAEGLIRQGVKPDNVLDWFNAGPNAAAIRANLVRIGQALNVQVEAHRPGVQGNRQDTSNDALRLQLCRALERAFGSIDAARRVQLALDSLKSEDFDWYETMRANFGR